MIKEVKRKSEANSKPLKNMERVYVSIEVVKRKRRRTGGGRGGEEKKKRR